MENNMEYTGDAIQDTSEGSSMGPSIEVLATIKGSDTSDEPIFVSTPGGVYMVHSEKESQNCPVIKVPTSDLTAIMASPGHSISVPVYVHDAAKAFPKQPPPPPYVRVILSNAIITSDGESSIDSAPQVIIEATIKAFGTPGSMESITLFTPGGAIQLITTMPPEEYPIYSVLQTEFVAADPDGFLPVHLYNSDGLVPPLVASGVQIILTDLTVTALTDPS